MSRFNKQPPATPARAPDQLAASRQLPDAKRLAFTADVQTLFQEYASGQR